MKQPTPWYVEFSDWQVGTHCIRDANHVRVADGMTKELAQRIVQAINAHDDLVAALKVARDELAADQAHWSATTQERHWKNRDASLTAAIQQINDALGEEA